MPKNNLKICPRYVQDLRMIGLRYAQDMSKICPSYAQDMPKLCPRSAQDMTHIFIESALWANMIQIFPIYVPEVS